MILLPTAHGGCLRSAAFLLVLARPGTLRSGLTALTRRSGPKNYLPVIGAFTPAHTLPILLIPLQFLQRVPSRVRAGRRSVHRGHSGWRCVVGRYAATFFFVTTVMTQRAGRLDRNLPYRADQSRDQRASIVNASSFVPILGVPATTRQGLISCLERFHASPMVAVRDTAPRRTRISAKR